MVGIEVSILIYHIIIRYAVSIEFATLIRRLCLHRIVSQRPPLILDIDGTLTRPDGRGIDPRVFDPLREWDGPIVLSTGKATPYPIALCQFLGVPEQVIAENGGVIVTDDRLLVVGDREASDAVAQEYTDAGFDLGWTDVDTVNRWRETELAVARSRPREPLERIATAYGLTVIDTGYAYHVCPPEQTKGRGLEIAADDLGLDLESCVAVGDSENDVSTFDRVGTSFAVANADQAAKDGADVVLDGVHATGTLEAMDRIRER